MTETQPSVPPNPQAFHQIEAEGGEVKELMDPLVETEDSSMMSLDEACKAITRLEGLCCHKRGTEYLQARVVLRDLRRAFQCERTSLHNIVYIVKS